MLLFDDLQPLIPCKKTRYLMVQAFVIRLTYLDLSLSIFMKSCCSPAPTYCVFSFPLNPMSHRRFLACINSLNQTNIIDDSVWQSCIFEGLIFEWFTADIMHFGFKGQNAIYGILWHQPRPKDEGLLRCGTHYVSQALKVFVAPGYIVITSPN